ncbi:hypothetical protein INR49_012296 [Caranx melampygus]|nr:hypothetical protein INR49_012296 [Caranx melampygus]
MSRPLRMLRSRVTEYLNSQESAKSARLACGCTAKSDKDPVRGGTDSNRNQTYEHVFREGEKSSGLNIWRYGDFRADDADEFGYSR